MTPLSSAQQSVWFSYRWEGPSTTYTVPVWVRVSGPLDQRALVAAWDDVLARHDALRTRFAESGGEPGQTVVPLDARARVTQVRASGEAAARAVVDGLVARPFALERESPVRAVLIQIADDLHVFAVVMHHIVCDGWSVDVLLADLATAYAARKGGAAPTWDDEPTGYAEYVAWQRELLGDLDDPSDIGGAQLAYWRAKLADLPAELPLPRDRPRPASASTAGGRVRFTLPESTSAGLAELARATGATEFMALQTAVAVLLHRLGAGDDIPLGTPTAGRTEEELARTVGLFVNPQVLRVDLGGDPSFAELLGRVREDVVDGLSRQDLPFPRIVEAVQPSRLPGRHPLFQVGVELDAEPPRCPLSGVDTEVAVLDVDVSKFDLSFIFRPGREIAGTVEYATALFDHETAQALAERVLRLLDAVVADPDAPVSTFDVRTAAEAASTAHRDGPQVALPERTVLDLFQDRVAEFPHAIAFVADDVRLTYAELNAWVNRVAHGLLAEGVGPDVPVACVLPRSPEAVVHWLAIGKAGGVYTPIDPALPRDRVRAILTASDIRLVVTTAELATRFDADGFDSPVTLVTDHERAGFSEADPTDADRPARLSLDNAAYIIHTSGSSGTPKGVTVLHRALTNLWSFHTGVTFPPPGPGQERRRVLLTASTAFDTSWEAVLAMIAGHELHLAAESIRRDPAAIVAYVAEHGIDQLDVTPSFAQQLLADGLLTLPRPPAVLMLGGEAVPEALWEQCAAAPATRVFNYYGPSEFCIEATGCAVSDFPRSTIGVPVQNTRVLVLDERLRPVPVGVRGELYLAGANLGRGYAGQSARTAERFVANPFGAPGERMYRSGDLARWSRDGSLVFDGRADDQVKLRGFRIELEEIQRHLQDNPGVTEAAVVLREDEPGDKRIVAYTAGLAKAADLREWLESRLPDYMVPAAFVPVDALPLTRNAKLDRAALPRPDYAQVSTGRAPSTEIEKQVAELFAEVLKVDSVGLDDDFFAMGGHSLLATRLVNRVRGALSRDVDLMALFENPTVSGIVANLAEPGSAEARPGLAGGRAR